MLDILLIEDDPQYLMLVKRLLEDEGHTVRAAENGAKGLESYMQSPTTVVITDIFMPYKDGIEVIRALSRQQPRPAVIAMSGGTRIKSAQSTLDPAQILGAQQTLCKPFSRQDLNMALESLLITGVIAVVAVLTKIGYLGRYWSL
jgi:CheY-like chemotaxis protein